MSDKPAPPLAPALLDACAPTLDGPADPPARADEDQAPTLDVSPGGVTAHAPISTPAIPHMGVPRVLKHWDRYEVQELIGAGGMGAVYKARDPRLGRLVALKLIHPQLGGSLSNVSSALLRHFQREARLQATLDHKNICRVYEIGELPALDDSPACPYIAMQYIVGQPLHHALPGLTLPEKLQLFIAIADALHHAHRHGLVHRDIKPDDVAVCASRR